VCGAHRSVYIKPITSDETRISSRSKVSGEIPGGRNQILMAISYNFIRLPPFLRHKRTSQERVGKEKMRHIITSRTPLEPAAWVYRKKTTLEPPASHPVLQIFSQEKKNESSEIQADSYTDNRYVTQGGPGRGSKKAGGDSTDEAMRANSLERKSGKRPRTRRLEESREIGRNSAV